MNRYEKYVDGLGFTKPKQGRTKTEDVVGLTFEACDVQKAAKILGKCKNYKPNLFVYKIASDKAIRIDTLRHRILLANSKTAVKALLRTVS